MMHRQFEVRPGQFVTLAMDNSVLPIARRLWALAYARLIDFVTGQAVPAPVTVLVGQRGITARYVSDGYIVLIGTPYELFPDLSQQGYDIDYSIYATGYQPQPHLVGPLPAMPGFPTTVKPVDFGNIYLLPV